MSQTTKQILISASGGFFASVLVLFLSWAFGGINQIVSRMSDNVRIPEGAIVMSNKECSVLPGKWEPYERAAGRFPIATGQTTDATGASGNVFELGQEGGAYKHMLTPAEMPTHGHQHNERIKVSVTCQNGDTEKGCKGFDYNRSVSEAAETTGTGDGRPHENMPPYVVLNFCRKT